MRLVDKSRDGLATKFTDSSRHLSQEAISWFTRVKSICMIEIKGDSHTKFAFAVAFLLDAHLDIKVKLLV